MFEGNQCLTADRTRIDLWGVVRDEELLRLRESSRGRSSLEHSWQWFVNNLVRPRVVPSEGATQLALSEVPLQIWQAGRTGNHLSVNVTHMVGQLTGPIDVQAMSRGLVTLVRRHRILTAKIEERETEAYLRLDGSFLPQIEVVNLRECGSHVPDTSREEWAANFAAKRIWQPFDFDPETAQSSHLMRSFLIVLSDVRSIFGIVIHHAIADFMSLVIIAEDLTRFYRDFASGKIPRYSEQSLSFIDHRINLDNWLASPSGKLAIAHWQAKVAGAPLCALPSSPAGTHAPNGSLRSLSFSIPSALSSRLRELSRVRKAKLFTIVLVGKLLAIMKACDMRDVLINIGHFGRDQSQLFRLVGCFPSWVPVRAALRGKPDFGGFLSQVEKDCQDLVGAAPVSIATLGIQELERCPFFNFADYSTEINSGLFSIPFSVAWPDPQPQPDGSFRHSLLIHRAKEGLAGRLFYRSDLYAALIIKHFIVDMLTVLAIATNAPDTQVEKILSLCDLPQHRQPFDAIFDSPAPTARANSSGQLSSINASASS